MYIHDLPGVTVSVDFRCLLWLLVELQDLDELTYDLYINIKLLKVSNCTSIFAFKTKKYPYRDTGLRIIMRYNANCFKFSTIKCPLGPTVCHLFWVYNFLKWICIRICVFLFILFLTCMGDTIYPNKQKNKNFQIFTLNKKFKYNIRKFAKHIHCIWPSIDKAIMLLQLKQRRTFDSYILYNWYVIIYTVALLCAIFAFKNINPTLGTPQFCCRDTTWLG